MNSLNLWDHNSSLHKQKPPIVRTGVDKSIGHLNKEKNEKKSILIHYISVLRSCKHSAIFSQVSLITTLYWFMSKSLLLCITVALTQLTFLTWWYLQYFSSYYAYAFDNLYKDEKNKNKKTLNCVIDGDDIYMYIHEFKYA